MKHTVFTRRVLMPMSRADWAWAPVAKIQLPKLVRCSIQPSTMATPAYQTNEALNNPPWTMTPVNSLSGRSGCHTGMWPPEMTTATERATNIMPRVVMKEGIPKVSVTEALI